MFEVSRVLPSHHRRRLGPGRGSHDSSNNYIYFCEKKEEGKVVASKRKVP